MMAAPPFPSLSDIEPEKLEAITPSQFIEFTIPNTTTRNRLLHFPILRVAVCDSPLATADDESPTIAAMIVPKNRETDWNFCTESGHMQLLFKCRTVSRLILIGNIPPHQGPSVYKPPPVTDLSEKQRLQNELKPLLLPLHPKSSSNNGSPETLFLTDEDDVAYRVTVAKFEGPIVGEFLVEDVELVGNTDRDKQLRRRLRFKRMPRVVQSQALLLPIIGDDEATTQTNLEILRNIENARFEADTSVLVHQYLTPMVAGMFLISSHLNDWTQKGFAPRALCLGVGGGVLLNFLNTELGFEVTGVDSDQTVVTSAGVHFGLNQSGSIRVYEGDAIEYIQTYPPGTLKFDVVFVDLDSSDAKIGFSAPPPEFVTNSVFEGLKLLVDDNGGVIINVVHMNEVFYTTLVKELKEVFHRVFEIDVGDEDGFVVIATVSEAPSSNNDDGDNLFVKMLKSVIQGSEYIDSIVELRT